MTLKAQLESSDGGRLINFIIGHQNVVLIGATQKANGRTQNIDKQHLLHPQARGKRGGAADCRIGQGVSDSPRSHRLHGVRRPPREGENAPLLERGVVAGAGVQSPGERLRVVLQVVGESRRGRAWDSAQVRAQIEREGVRSEGAAHGGRALSINKDQLFQYQAAQAREHHQVQSTLPQPQAAPLPPSHGVPALPEAEAGLR